MSPSKGSIALSECVLPEDIMLCILTRLPIKSIHRFRSVCKPWRDLFSTPEFTKMHKGQYSSNPNNQSIIIHHYAENIMSLLEIESDETKPKILDHPRPEIRHKEIVGCCNGLICLIRPHLVPSNIVLWNPAMKLYKYVRVSGNESFFSSTETESLGFEYDAVKDDYKVVRIFCFLEKEEDEVGVCFEVYSVSTDSWITMVPDFEFRVLLSKNSVIVNGNPYWVAEVEEE
ncbi:hypothetical protein CASFOL_027798 [Castilleja foliolosa]|uniref:F-box domain-containing protein n=1 Tax=Castilleja foliolosa TaxID=1961234 RepID=A0ABD3CGQ8_9LAMI